MVERFRDEQAYDPVDEVPEEEQSEEQSTSQVLPILPLRGTVVFPLTLVPLAAGQPRSLRLIDDVVSGDRIVGMVLQKDPEQEGAGPGETYEIGTIASIHQMMRVPDGTVRLAVQGQRRMRIVEWLGEEPYLTARVEEIPEEVEDTVEIKALVRNSQELFQRLVSLVSNLPEELVTAALNVDDPLHLVYLIASNLRMEAEERQALLELDSVRAKLQRLNAFMSKELDLLELGKKIQSEVQEEVGKTQREYYLREQLKAIQRELGETNEQEAEINELRAKIDEAGMPEEAEREARRELDRLSKLPPAAAEYGVIRTYLDWLTALPWNKSSEEGIDVAKARQILDEDHYDLEKIKERILEYLAVRRLRQERGVDAEEDSREPILCFVGPPGVGKTSLAQSIARALGRRFTRMSLGGVRDEAEIRGHRRTYIGAMPGRIIQAIRRAGTNDPVFVLDEIDKLGADWRGDPSSALLEVLDPEQNHSFRDHYLDVPFDLSKVMFIATANMLDTIPAPLRDRMEILQLSGYTDEEKLNIARKYLVPKQLKRHALSPDEVSISDEALLEIIQHYTREAGVRNLEREIASVARKVATRLAEGQEIPSTIEAEHIRELLGKRRFFYEELSERTSVPGVAIGVGVTPVGGDIMFIEASRMPGRGNLTVTGQLGDVMKESSQAALSLVRARASDFGIDPDFFKESDLHVHVPAGAIPKDGPSAGVAMTVALVSLLTGIPVRDEVAMTGEITLRGQVLPVGGIKEKALAAARAGITTFILPKRNEPDLDDLPPSLKENMEFVLVDSIDEALRVAMPDEFKVRVSEARAGRAPEREVREVAAASQSGGDSTF
ncbi:endopeptidase La [Sphaerobacter thermophilus]|uniref:Lon protease n=1 Tax=Sphaerobacter thermophilus (strain ATCC 49802 / DSM 20745 / KCCM 41009 / NCIMB 13125 / S 6022) TaxID=479434 RepID=D1C135_SPHTD|nr:endopeptidase La [Sphaerobacter thermophilus]ACZ37952.1 ATP-dependent protease La [Sphaerobacter thermophilus DSM 20745]PZN66002.1 MAG: endopeptidase La [Sphaerobacter thermophilus]